MLGEVNEDINGIFTSFGYAGKVEGSKLEGGESPSVFLSLHNWRGWEVKICINIKIDFIFTPKN